MRLINLFQKTCFVILVLIALIEILIRNYYVNYYYEVLSAYDRAIMLAGILLVIISFEKGGRFILYLYIIWIAYEVEVAANIALATRTNITAEEVYIRAFIILLFSVGLLIFSIYLLIKRYNKIKKHRRDMK